MATSVRTYRDLIVWQKAFELCRRVYGATSSFPREERFGLTAEARKTSRSVVYNIAEGHKRRSTAEYMRFLDIAWGSGAELETQLLLATALGYLDQNTARPLLDLYAEVDRMLGALQRSLQQRMRGPSRP